MKYNFKKIPKLLPTAYNVAQWVWVLTTNLLVMSSNPNGILWFLPFQQILKQLYGQILFNLKILKQWEYLDHNVVLSTLLSTGIPFNLLSNNIRLQTDYDVNRLKCSTINDQTLCDVIYRPPWQAMINS